ncbi:MAG: hypothetical protein JOZ58_00965 [Acetobacteraceae bacterium]|nr:hypothetical protein [Acetobacteraceae bacterium]
MAEEKFVFVGSPIPPWMRMRQEGARFIMDNQGPRLFLGFASPLPHEIISFRKVNFRFGLVSAGDHTFYVIFHIEGCTDGWCEAPYAFGLLQGDQRNLPHRRASHGWILGVAFFDITTSIVRSIRLGTMTPACSDILDHLIAGQKTKLSEFTPERHDAEIVAAEQRWNHSGRHDPGCADH